MAEPAAGSGAEEGELKQDIDRAADCDCADDRERHVPARVVRLPG